MRTLSLIVHKGRKFGDTATSAAFENERCPAPLSNEVRTLSLLVGARAPYSSLKEGGPRLKVMDIFITNAIL